MRYRLRRWEPAYHSYDVLWNGCCPARIEPRLWRGGFEQSSQRSIRVGAGCSRMVLT
jgi:hypothetical protein